MTRADLKIEIQQSGFTLQCHRGIVKHRAKYLYSLISYETSSHLVTLNTLDKETLTALLRYVYAGHLDLQGLSLP